MSEIQLNTIEEAIEDFREGKFLIVVDDEDRVYYAPRSRKNVAKSWSWICKLPITPLY